VVAHAGGVGLRLVADRTGLTGELSKALARRSFVPVHDRGRVLVDVAVMIADGGEAICDIEVMRHQAQVLGPVASAPTVWRTLDGGHCCVDGSRRAVNGGSMKRNPGPRPPVRVPSGFTGFRFPPEVILLAVRWYLR